MSARQPLSGEQIAHLRTFDTPTICNVIELFASRPQTDGYTDPRITACFSKMAPMVGYAFTATFRSAAPPGGGAETVSFQQQMEALSRGPQPPVVVFGDLDDPPKSATFGEVVCTIYKTFGAVGLITSGAGRDLDQVEAIDFPVFAGGTICSHGYPQIIDHSVPVSVGGLTILPGDLIHADRNGITTIPAEIAHDLGDYCQKFVDAEQVILGYLQTTKSPDAAELGRRCDQMKTVIEELKGRARRHAADRGSKIS